MGNDPNAGALSDDDVNTMGIGDQAASPTVFDPGPEGSERTVLDPAALSALGASKAANEPRRVLAPKPAAANITLPIGFRLFEYRIDGVLGQGGFGIAYAATDVNLASKVVIKEYLPEEFAYRAA